MTPEDRIARAHRAEQAWNEFLSPMLAELRDEYRARIVEVANTELRRDKRADKLTALSNALRIVESLEGGMKAILLDGEMALKDKIRADRVEGMTQPARRLLGIAPY